MESLHVFRFFLSLIIISSSSFFLDCNIRRDPNWEEGKGRDCFLLKKSVWKISQLDKWLEKSVSLASCQAPNSAFIINKWSA